MTLLDNIALDFPSWVQAITGILGLVLAIIAMFQSKKIQELTDITIALFKQTDELTKHNHIQSKRYDIEADTALYSRIPNFQFHDDVAVFYKDKVNEVDPTYRFDLINLGASAHKILSLNKKLRIEHFITPGGLPVVGELVLNKRYISVFAVESENIGSSNPDILTFKFYFKDDIGRVLSQTVTYNVNSYSLDITKPIVS